MKWKKSIASALICCMSFGSAASAAWGAEAASNTFADLSGHWSKADVEYLASKGIIDGVEVNGQRLIMPDKSITRAEYIKILVGALGNKYAKGETASFKDVSAAHWAYKYVETAKEKGLVDGYQDGSFKPDAPISRAELATLLVRGYQLKEQRDNPVSFADVTPDFWAFGAIQTAASNKLVEGIIENGLTVFKPAVSATRAESVTVIARYLKQQEAYAVKPDVTPEQPETPEAQTPAEGGSNGGSSGGSSGGSRNNNNRGITVNLTGADLITSIGGGNPIAETDSQGNKLELTGLNLQGFRGTAADISISLEQPEQTFTLADTVVPGVTGPVIEFNTNGRTFTNATLTFNVAEIPAKANLVAAYYNETTGKFEFLSSTYNAADDTLSFTTNHNSKYVLIDKLAWEQAWKNSLSVTDGVYKPYIDYAFIIDSSGSMSWTDPDDLRKSAVTDLVYDLNYNPGSLIVTESVTVAGNVYTNSVYSESDRAAIIDFDDSADLVSTFSADETTVAGAVYLIDSSGGTHIFSGLKLAFDEFEANGNANNRWVAVLLTDGQDTSNVAPDWNMIQAAYGKGVTVVTMGLSDAVDKDYLEKIALLGGGQYFHVQTAEQLEASFQTVVDTTRHDEFIDADGDGIDDYYEITGMLLENGMLVKTSIDPVTGKDTDQDGLTDGEEMGQPVDVVITAEMVPPGSELVGKTVKMFTGIKSMPTIANVTP